MIVIRSVIKMMKKEKPMMSVTAIIQGAQAQHWGRSLAGLGPPHVPLGKDFQVEDMCNNISTN